jgi:hypothetical protein
LKGKTRQNLALRQEPPAWLFSWRTDWRTANPKLEGLLEEFMGLPAL